MTVNDFVAVVALVATLSFAYETGAAIRNRQKWIALAMFCLAFAALCFLAYIGS